MCALQMVLCCSFLFLLFCRLSRRRSMTLLSSFRRDAYGVIGLEETHMSELLQAAAALRSKIEEFARVLSATKSDYDCFFNWLLRGKFCFFRFAEIFLIKWS